MRSVKIRAARHATNASPSSQRPRVSGTRACGRRHTATRSGERWRPSALYTLQKPFLPVSLAGGSGVWGPLVTDSPCPALEVRLLFGEKSPSLAVLPVPACRQCWPPRLHISPIASGAPRLGFLSHLTHEGLNPLCLRSRCVLDTSSLSPGTPPPFAPQPPSTWAFSGGLWPPGTGWVWSRHSYPIAQ